MDRREYLDYFYELLGDLEDRLGGKQKLGECHGRMGWPRCGVYFFFEPGELRMDGRTLRVVRVGTHALTADSNSTLWKRLRQHRGALSGSGNHRSSIFRFHIGTAIKYKEGWKEKYPKWEQRKGVEKILRNQEISLEKLVSQYICSMPFLWVKADSSPKLNSYRGYIEKNAIGLLSSYGKLGTIQELDPPSSSWLGYFCKNENVRKSGLWNSNHIKESYEKDFFKIFEDYTKNTRRC